MTTIRTMTMLNHTMPSVEPILDASAAGAVAVAWAANAAALKLESVRTGWLRAALAIASNRPMPISAAGRRMCRSFFIRLAGKYIMRPNLRNADLSRQCGQAKTMLDHSQESNSAKLHRLYVLSSSFIL